MPGRTRDLLFGLLALLLLGITLWAARAPEP